MKITVTQQHIDFGLRGSCRSDPIALAMMAAGLDDPWISPSYLRWRVKGKTYYSPVPDMVSVFMQRFDQGRPAGPFSFELDDFSPNNGREG